MLLIKLDASWVVLPWWPNQGYDKNSNRIIPVEKLEAVVLYALESVGP